MTLAATGPAPEIRAETRAILEAPDPRVAVRDLAGQIISALRSAPHFVRVRGLDPTEDRSLAVALARTIAITPPTPPGLSRERLLKVSFTQVRIDPEKAAGPGSVTAYSRTNQPLALHSDSSYMARPHALVLFQFVRADPGGGASVMACAEDVLAALPAPLVETLARPDFPFGKGPMPVLFGRRAAPQIRYYRSQIDTAVADDAPLSDEAAEALNTLDAVLANDVRTYEFGAESGEIIFMDNTRVLHGRRGFGAQSARLMYRIRMHCGCLG